MICYRKATLEDLQKSWDKEILENPNDSRYVRWKEQFISVNAKGSAATFMIFSEEEPIGQGTLLFDPSVRTVHGHTCLCDGLHTANINTLRIEKKYEAQGHISKLMKLIEQYAIDSGITRLTIGVEAAETRNLAIYLHWGYNKFIMSEEDEGELVLYYGKDLA